MSHATEQVLAALQKRGVKVRPSGTGWSGQCPAHEDRNPSLSIRTGRDGRCLVKCHAGCETEAIVAELGLGMKDLMPEREEPVRRAMKSAPKTPKPSSRDFATADDAVAALECTLGPCSRRWVYTDSWGQPVGETARWDPPGERKKIRPVSRQGDRWAIGAMPAPRPLLYLPEIAVLPDGARVYICEGEKAVEAARAIGLLATTSAGGAEAAAKTDWSPMKSKSVVILPDNDDAGEKYAEQVAILSRRAGADEIMIVRLIDRWPDLPGGGDIADVLEREGGDAEAVREALDGLAVGTPHEQFVEHPSARCFKPFPVDALPEPIRSYVVAGAMSIGCDTSFLALPILAGLAGAIGNTRRIMLKSDWLEPAVVWVAIIGESGCGKSPGFRCALKAIRSRQHRLMKDHERAMRVWESENILYEIALANRKKGATRSGAPPEPPEPPVKPICPRVWIEDVTSEALAELLHQNPRGLLSLRNELSGWFSFGQYKNGGGNADIARWLQMFDAEPIMVDRKTSGSTYISGAAVSVAGGIQPKILERLLGEQHRDNGMLARLLITYPPRRAKRWTEEEIPLELDAEMATVFDRLYDIEPDLNEDEEPVPRSLLLTPGAKRAWISFVEEHGRQQLEHSGDIAAAFSKLEAYAARIGLVIQCTRVAAGDQHVECPDRVDQASIEAGIRIVRWFLDEALRIYAILGEDETAREIRNHRELIERRGGSVSLRDWQRLRSLETSADAEAELQQLVEADIGAIREAAVGPRGGRPSRRFVLYGSVPPDTTVSPDASIGVETP
jgi:hypothetical protein